MLSPYLLYRCLRRRCSTLLIERERVGGASNVSHGVQNGFGPAPASSNETRGTESNRYGREPEEQGHYAEQCKHT